MEISVPLQYKRNYPQRKALSLWKHLLTIPKYLNIYINMQVLLVLTLIFIMSESKICKSKMSLWKILNPCIGILQYRNIYVCTEPTQNSPFLFGLLRILLWVWALTCAAFTGARARWPRTRTIRVKPCWLIQVNFVC